MFLKRIKKKKKIMKKQISDIGVPDFDELDNSTQCISLMLVLVNVNSRKQNNKDQLMLVAWWLFPHVLSTTYTFYYRYLSQEKSFLFSDLKIEIFES